MIEFKQVELHYHYDEYALLKNLSFTLIDGINTILCDSQSGKSSICKLLTKQFAPTNGQISVDGLDITSIANKSLGILYIPANPTFFENRSVRFNVKYPLKVRKTAKTEQIKRFDEVTSLVGLNNVDLKIKKLTLAERKKAALARGLTVARQIVLLDDFCDSAEQIDEIVKLFGNVTIVILTSDINLARGNVVVLDGGVSLYQGDVDGAKECRSNLSWIVDMIRSK